MRSWAAHTGNVKREEINLTGQELWPGGGNLQASGQKEKTARISSGRWL